MLGAKLHAGRVAVRALPLRQAGKAAREHPALVVEFLTCLAHVATSEHPDTESASAVELDEHHDERRLAGAPDAQVADRYNGYGQAPRRAQPDVK